MRKLHPGAAQALGDANPWLMSAYEQQTVSAPYVLPANFADVEYWRGLTDADIPALDVSARATRFGVCLLSAWGNRWKTESDGRFTSSSAPVRKEWCTPNFLETRLKAMFSQQWLSAQDKAMCQSWELTLQDVQPDDLVYLDPPYPETLGYGNQLWTIGDLLDVVDWVAEHKDRVSIVVSNVADVSRLFQRVGLKCNLVQGPKAMKTRRKRTEVIAYSILNPIEPETETTLFNQIFK